MEKIIYPKLTGCFAVHFGGADAPLEVRLS